MSFAFRLLAPGLGCGDPAPAGWLGAAVLDLVVLVGVTGVGKTTLLAALGALPGARLLPDRRQLTDAVILAPAGGPPPADRAERFAATRRFAAAEPGGMAAVLAALRLAPELATGPVLFDGLRGEAEVRHAAAALPRARFVALTAPNALRLERLLGRADPFDRTAAPGGEDPLAAATGLLEPAEVAALRRRLATGALSPRALAEKLAILAAEQRGYDPGRAVAALAAAAAERLLVIDTAQLGPAATAAAARGFIAARR
ncbi:MAG: hypothetical protein U1E53_03560 [Dongiaceae bacterium]